MSRQSSSSPWWNSKRLCTEDECNHLNSTFNSTSKLNTRWSYTADASFVEPEILEDMGVSIIEDDAVNCDTKVQSPDFTISLNNAASNERLPINENNETYESEPNSLYIDSNFNSNNVERLEQEQYDVDDLCNHKNPNESGYSSSRVENEPLGDAKDEFHNKKLNISNDNDSLNHFYLSRRKRKLSYAGNDEFNKLSDEMILMIFRWLPKRCLVRCMLVCKRWCQIARDEALWIRLDLSSKVLIEGTMEHILPRGVQILRLAQAEIADPIFMENVEVLNSNYVCKLQYLDLSMAVISPNGLATLLLKCKLLKNLSLESCILNTACCNAIRLNKDLSVLNLAMCEGIDLECVTHLINLKSLTALNVAWCSLDADSVSLLCKYLPPVLERLNISGCRKTMTDDNIKELVKSCPKLKELDLSDCTLLTMNSAPYLLNLSILEHLSLSRCYSIPPSTFVRLAYMPCLMYLDIFGLMSDPMSKSVQSNCGDTQINKFRFSSIARPTVGVRRTSIWGLRVRD
ncbi:PREDICTED: S-phase kinase-associated protein 2-like isoform X2 [Polistes dominula]|uniref:S-phase kinase-associated protein 2-like isoform X2 n=1 Tax=Polistes dominula TaxID=743375 RepID=A0ABM1J278_POLDO|nr:PREDICTED: S-phase kinase-associated protein 2-like isoform X2 [Polistes dominula]